MPKRGQQDEFPGFFEICGFYFLGLVWPLKPVKTTLQMILEGLLEVLEVLLEVLDLSWGPWR